MRSEVKHGCLGQRAIVSMGLKLPAEHRADYRERRVRRDLAKFKLRHYPLFTAAHSEREAYSQLLTLNMPCGFKSLPSLPQI